SKNCFNGCCGVNNSPSLTNLAATSPSNENESTLTGAVLDLDVSQSHWVVIDWGDGSADTTNILAVGENKFNATHQYLDNTSDLYSVHVTVRDNWGATGSGNVQIQLNHLPRFKSVTKLDNGHILLQLQGTPGAPYRIETSVDLKT